MANDRWLVISNCQTYGLANSLQSQCSEIDVSGADTIEIKRETAYWTEQISSFNKAFINPSIISELPKEILDAGNYAEIPSVATRIFHPDIFEIYAEDALLRSPVGHYHSGILFACFTLGLDESETLSRFNADTYRRLGYMSSMADEKVRIARGFQGAGIEVERYMTSWTRHGAFMHTNNHPKIHTLYDVASAVLDAHHAPHVRDKFIPHDNLMTGSQYPVYSEIAEHYGVVGSYVFRDVGSYKPFNLKEFVRSSFAVYRRYELGKLRLQPRFEEELNYIIDEIKRSI